ncbi:MAG: class I SAM-dependent methyltransferase [Phycisphaerae bacterium]
MTDTSVQKFYKLHALFYDNTRWAILHGRKRAVKALGLQAGDSVLEIGCGTGLNFRYLHDEVREQGTLVGLDFSQDMLRQAEKRVAKNGWKNVQLVHGDATTVKIDRKFDAILFAYSLTMIPDWRGSLRNAYEHLRPGGRLVVLDFSKFSKWGPLKPVMRTWLRLNHVDTGQEYTQAVRDVVGNVTVTEWLGGYNFTAVGKRSE